MWGDFRQQPPETRHLMSSCLHTGEQRTWFPPSILWICITAMHASERKNWRRSAGCEREHVKFDRKLYSVPGSCLLWWQQLNISAIFLLFLIITIFDNCPDTRRCVYIKKFLIVYQLSEINPNSRTGGGKILEIHLCAGELRLLLVYVQLQENDMVEKWHTKLHVYI